MKVSIIIPIYNSEKTLTKCVESVLNQTYQDFEILLINDFSYDNTQQIAQELAGQDRRIILLNNSRNLGAALSRNQGLKKVTGDWIAFCDADDYPDENWLKDFVEGISENVDMVVQGFYCDNWPGSDSGRIVAYQGKNDRDTVVDALCRHQVFGYLWCKMYRASIIREHHILFKQYRFLEDELFNLEYLKYVRKITCVPQCNYHYDCPDFYAKYGDIDNFDLNLSMFQTTCNSFGDGPMRIKDLFVERTSDWLLAAYRQNFPNKQKKLADYCTTIGPYLPYARYCRKAIRILRYIVFPKNETLSHLGVTFYTKVLNIR